METVMTKPVVITDMKKKASDILLAISWRELANNYFHKSSSWLYHKMDGIDGNGGKGGFTSVGLRTHSPGITRSGAFLCKKSPGTAQCRGLV